MRRLLTTLTLTALLGVGAVAQPPTADQVRTPVEFCNQVNIELIANVEAGLHTVEEAEAINQRCLDIYVK